MEIQEMTNRIFLGDCLQIMKDIPNQSVDMVLCDLPYQVLHKNNPNAQWDRIIPFEPLWKQYNRIIKPNGAIVLFAQGMFTAQLMMSNRKMWRYNLVWDKVTRTGFLNANRMPLRTHEDICVFYRNLPTYNPQMEKGSEHHRSGGEELKGQLNRCYGDFKATKFLMSNERFPTSIIRITQGSHCDGYRVHPTQKPVDLLRYLVLTYTNEGDTVLDNCMGSGSTIVAAIRENRQYIGIEKEEKYYDIANRRIAAEMSQLSLF